MSDAALALPPDEEAPEAERPAPVDRDADLLGRRRRSPLRERLDDLFTSIQKGFEDQYERSADQEEFWDCYNCEVNGNRYYNGIAQIYWPIIHDAIEARATRFVNQLFPQGGRYVEAVDSDGSGVPAVVALLDHYIRKTKMKTQIAKPLIRNGDVEGQYNLYVDWGEFRRRVVSRETHGPRDPQTGAEAPGEEIEDIREEEIIEGRPVFEVLHDCDVLVLPATADSIEEALASGGSVTIVRRMSKSKIDQLVKQGTFRKDEAEDLKNEMRKAEKPGFKDIEKHIIDHVGIRKGGKEATVWETWTMLPLGEDGRYAKDGDDLLCRVFFGPYRSVVGCKRNPYWNDLCPLLSAPVQKMSGSFKGPSLIQPIQSLQYEANDAANEGADAATLSAAPVVVRDAEKYNGPLVYNVGAVWDIPPDAVKLLEFPDLTPRAATRIQFAIQQIFQTLGVNPAMLPQQTRAGKPNQAMIAQEQQVDLLTTSDVVSVSEEGIFTPAMGLTVDFDYQFRDRNLTVRMFGEMGKQAVMQEVAPLQNRNGFTFIWRGGDQVRQNAMMMQQGTGWLNVLRGMRQDLMAEGMQVRLGPLIEAGTRNIFGPVLGSQVIIDQREQLTMDPGTENQMLADGFEVGVHPLDDDQKHIMAHQMAYQQTGDPHGTIRLHLQLQLKQAQAKAQAAVMAKMAQAMQGQQQGGPPGQPSRAGGPPRQGAQPAGPRLIKGPPGAIHPDQLPRAGAVPMPRKF